jgi:hypothetical protein
MSRKRPPVTHGQGAVFLDPVECGSSIRWKITDSGYSKQPEPYCEIALTDCNRAINWQQDCTEEGITKIDRAIAILTECRDLMKKHKYKPEPDDSDSRDPTFA